MGMCTLGHFLVHLIFLNGCLAEICGYYSTTLTRLQYISCSGSCCGTYPYQHCCPSTNPIVITVGAVIGGLIGIAVILVTVIFSVRRCKKKKVSYTEKTPFKKFRPQYPRPPSPVRKSHQISNAVLNTHLPTDRSK